MKFCISSDFEKVTLGQECSDFSIWHWVAAGAKDGAILKEKLSLNPQRITDTPTSKITFMTQ